MYQHRMTYFCRIGAFILNIAMLMGSLAIIGVGVWMNNDSNFDKDLKSVIFSYDSEGDLGEYKFQARVWVIVAYWTIFGMALGALLISIIGSIAAIRRTGCIIWGYLALMLSLVIMEVGIAVVLLIQRSSLRKTILNLIYSIFEYNDIKDMQIIQNTYDCCQSVPGMFNCYDHLPQCTETVWNSVDNTMMISGIVLLPILFLQIVTVILYAPIMIDHRKNEADMKLENRFNSVNIERF